MQKMVTDSPVAVKLKEHVLKAAEFALQRGLSLVALCGAECDFQRHGKKGHAPTARGKVPINSGWSSAPIRSLADVPHDAGNIGIVTGFEVDALDIDDEAGLAWAQATQPSTPWRVMTGAGVRQHWYFRRRPDDVHTGMVLSLGDGKALHLRGESALVVAPFSVHWSGRSYTPVGDWGVPLSSLPFFNREAAEKIRGIRGDKRLAASACKVAAIADGRLPPSGKWTDNEVQRLLEDARERMLPRHRSEAFRAARYSRWLATLTPCRAGAADAEAMDVLRRGLVNLLLPLKVVLDIAAASDWATKAVEGDGVTPWPWTREQLRDVAIKSAHRSWATAFGCWVCAEKAVTP